MKRRKILSLGIAMALLLPLGVMAIPISNMKIKAKSKDGVTRVKVQIKHEMITYNEAKKKGVRANFIAHVVAKVGEDIVYELSSSQFLSKNLILKFKFLAKNDEVLVVTWTDLSGKSATESKKIK